MLTFYGKRGFNMSLCIKNIWNCKMKGSYVVEGSFVISICLLIIMSALLLAFSIYGESLNHIVINTDKEIEAVKVFRLIQSGKNILNGIVN